MPNLPSLTSDSVKARAHALGFEVCGITSAEPTHYAEYFLRWIAEEKAGEMRWLARDPERRSDPQKVLPGARSLIVLGLNYWQPHLEGRGRIARYAIGADYHEILQAKLSLLIKDMEAAGEALGQPVQSKLYVDTGPVLEKPLAERAGLGWQGKSTMLIHQKLGPWLLLGEIITTAELAPDEPARDRCGSCSRCMTACPTGAITGPYQLDARRCIAYLTIELKGSIPEELRPLIGDRVYGCDECLDVCPWNRFAKKTQESKFLETTWPQSINQQDMLHTLLRLTAHEFRQRFAGSPVLRVKRKGLQRNVCIVLGNIGKETDLPLLEDVATTHEEGLVREHAIWAVAQIKKRLTEGNQSYAKTRENDTHPAAPGKLFT